MVTAPRPISSYDTAPKGPTLAVVDLARNGVKWRESVHASRKRTPAFLSRHGNFGCTSPGTLRSQSRPLRTSRGSVTGALRENTRSRSSTFSRTRNSPAGTRYWRFQLSYEGCRSQSRRSLATCRTLSVCSSDSTFDRRAELCEFRVLCAIRSAGTMNRRRWPRYRNGYQEVFVRWRASPIEAP